MPKFRITSPRFVNGEYVSASPQFPAVIELEKAPDKSRENEWRGLHVFDEKIEAPKPAYAKTEPKHPQSSVVAHGEQRTPNREPAR